MKLGKYIALFCLMLAVSGVANAARMEAENSEYGFNGFTSEAFNAPVCIDLLAVTCLLSEQVFVSPSQRDNGIVVYDFKIKANAIPTSFVLTLSSAGFSFLDTPGGVGAFHIDARGVPGPLFDPNYQACPPATAGDPCNPVQSGPNASGLVTPNQPNLHTVSFTIPAGGLDFVLYVALDEGSLLDTDEEPTPVLGGPDPRLDLNPSNVTASARLLTNEVPEPNSLPVVGAGLAGLIVLGRRRLAKSL